MAPGKGEVSFKMCLKQCQLVIFLWSECFGLAHCFQEGMKVSFNPPLISFFAEALNLMCNFVCFAIIYLKDPWCVFREVIHSLLIFFWEGGDSTDILKYH
jgi:hypothetical protein